MHKSRPANCSRIALVRLEIYLLKDVSKPGVTGYTHVHNLNMVHILILLVFAM